MSQRSSPQFSFQGSPREAPETYQTTPIAGQGEACSDFNEYPGSTEGGRHISSALRSRWSRPFSSTGYVVISLVLMAFGAGLTMLVIYLTGHWASKGTSPPISIRNPLGNPQDAPDIHTILFGCPADLNQTHHCEQIPNWNASQGVPGPRNPMLPNSQGADQARWFVNHSIVDDIANVTAVSKYPQTIFFAQFTQNGSVEKIEPSTWSGGNLPLANNSQESIGPFQEVMPLTSPRPSEHERRGEDFRKDHNISDDHIASNLTEAKLSKHHGHRHNCTDKDSSSLPLTNSRWIPLM